MEGLLEQASKWETSGEYAKAVDSYIKIVPTANIEKDMAYRCWMKVKYKFFRTFSRKTG